MLTDFGGQLEAMLAPFSSKMGWGESTPTPFLLGLCYFSILGRPGPLLAQFGLDFGGFGPRFFRLLGSILEVSGHDLGPMCFIILVLFKAVLFLSFHWCFAGRAGGVTRSAKNSQNTTPEIFFNPPSICEVPGLPWTPKT